MVDERVRSSPETDVVHFRRLVDVTTSRSSANRKPDRLSKPSAFEPLQTSTKLLSNVRSYLEGCPTKTYLVVLQPGLSTADLSSSSSSDSGCAAVPRLCEGQRAEKVRTKLEVAEVVVAAGEDRKFEKSALELETYIRDLACKGRDGVEVKSLVLGALPARGTARQEALSDNGESSPSCSWLWHEKWRV